MTGRMVGSQVYETQTYKTQYGSHVEYDEDSRVRKISYQAQYKYGTLDTPALAQQAYTFGYSNATGNLETLTFADNAGLPRCLKPYMLILRFLFLWVIISYLSL